MRFFFRNQPTLLLLTLILLTACAPSRSAQKKTNKIIQGDAGRIIQPYSISIDTKYDSRLDHLIPGYKLLPIVIRNVSLQPITMDVRQDRWVVIGENGKKYPAFNSLRIKNPVEWRNVPEELRSIIDYPEVLPIGYSVTFDLLLSPQANLDYFKEIRYYNATLRQEFSIQKEY